MEQLTKLLGKAAPWLAAAAAGPGGLAAQAIKTLAGALGSGSTVEQVTAALAGATPEQLQGLKRAELEFKARMQALGVEHIQALERIAADDRKDARQMQIATRSWIPGALAIGITVGFFGVLAAMIFGQWEPKENNALLILLGSLGTSWGAVVNYYFGSSAGSARKDELLANSQPATPGRP